MRVLPLVVVALCVTGASARAATDPMELMRSMPCAYLRDMLMPLHDGRPPESFVTENSRFIAPESWTPEMLRLFDDQVRRCVATESRAMAPFGQGSMLGNYLRSADAGVDAYRRRTAAGGQPRDNRQPEIGSQAGQQAQELDRLWKESEAKREQRQQRLAQAVQPPVAQSNPAPVSDDCPALKAHDTDLSPLLASLKADVDKLEGKTPAELALAPELACNVLNDQAVMYKAMLGYAQECPANSKVGGADFRNNVAGMVLQLQSQGRQMGCR